MRRKLPKEIEYQGAYDFSPNGTREPLLDVTIGLECITPVIGGCVRAREPDTVDIVRVPGIRGQLRFWWRALGSEPDPATLFANEMRVWGGVSGDADGAALASRVRVSVEKVDDQGQVFSPGIHDLKRSGNGLRPMPTWSVNQDLGYGMFPLQRNRDELTAAFREGKPNLPTWKIRKSLRFTLRLQLRAEATGPSARDKTDDVERILWALWVWVHFGGIGGRTTRGFGALAPTANISGLPSAWTQRFTRPPSSDPTAWLRSSWQEGPMRCTAPPVPVGWTHFGGSQLAVGAAIDEGAHSLLLNELRTFRQGVSWGREPSRRGKPAGQSHWPEPHMLRVRAENAEGHTDWAHTPLPAMRKLVSPTPTSTEWIPPRAAFGLPIVVKFMDDPELRGLDSPADATIGLERPGGRWMSPLRLRPIACSDGKHIPVMLLFAARPWTCAGDSITVDGKPIYLKEGTAQPGPTGPIESDGWMARGSGDAARAFFEWLSANRSFWERP
ncbi:MAG: type III-B CRISPR module RAMP protein Cmr1 [Deltaproteobacteria bacterium]|nr:MAG: type III-B CRISPR module RAMP protein Cmr1 [Deltaproteobacteria bacterium]